jgi:hypothetical protein
VLGEGEEGMAGAGGLDGRLQVDARIADTTTGEDDDPGLVCSRASFLRRLVSQS